MPTFIQHTQGRVTGLWGSALIRGANGKMRELKLGEVVHKGDMVLTTQDGIVQLTPDETRVTAPPQTTDTDRVIAELDREAPQAATAAGLSGADGGDLQPGLRVDRIVEGVTPAGLALAPIERAVLFDVGGTTAPEEQLPVPGISAISSVITALEQGPNVNLGLVPPVDIPATALVTVNAVPSIGQVQKADGSVVAAGSVISAGDLPGLIYVPPADYNGTALVGNFVYTVSNGSASATGTAIITVTAINDAPLAAADAANTAEDTPVTGNLLTNDTDADGGTLAISGFTIGGNSFAPGATATLPGVGALLINTNGSYTFTPVPNYSGPVPQATYTATDGTLTSTSTLTLSVTPVNDAPVAGDDLASTPINTPVTVAVLSNDSDAEGDPLTVSNPVLANPAQGTVAVGANGRLTFTPANNFTGPVTITYTVSDPNGGSDTATLTIDVGNNTPPDSADRSVAIAEDTSHTLVTGDFAFSDVDVGQTLNAIRIDTLPGVGQLLLNGTPVAAGQLVTAAEIAAGQLRFVPELNGNGAPYASFTFSVQDSAGAYDAVPNRVTFNVTPVNDPPAALNDAVSTDEDTPVTLSAAALLGNDTDADSNPLTLVSVQAPVNGTVALVGGNVVFTPAPDYNGPASFSYTISDGQGGTSTATVNIDVRPVVDPTISISNVTVNEAAGTASFTVTLSQATTATVSVAFNTSNGSATAGADYSAGAGTLSFAPGVISQTISVPITNDSVFEGGETFNVNLLTPTNATIADGLGLGTITDDGTGAGGTDNDTPSLSVTSGNGVEGGFAVFTVSLTNPSTAAVVFTPSLSSGTATVGTDTSALSALEVSTDGGTSWAAVSGNVSIAAGSTSVLLRLPTTDDALPEASETFSLTATPISGATATPASAAATLIDNDGPPSLFINDVTVNEAAGTATFTVNLSAASGQPVTVDFNTANGTATSGVDYGAGTGTLSFAPGVVSQTITVPIVNDAVFEGSETFNVNLVNPGNATISDALGVGTIADDGTGAGGTDNDSPRVGSVSSPTVPEGNNLDFTVTLSNASTTPTTVTLTPASGTATLGTDTNPALVSFDGGATFVALAAATVSVPAGATSFIVRVPTLDDTISEPGETITLAAATAANAAPVVGTGTITDNDGTPALAITGPVTLNEAAGTATFTVSLSNPSSATVTVNYGTVNGTATAGADFAAATGTLTFAAGVTSQTVTVAITNDAVFEGSETFSVVLNTPVGASIAIGSATTTIADDGTGAGGTDNDSPLVGSVSSPTVTEGNNLDFSVTLTNASATPTTVTISPASGTATLGTDTNPALVSFDGGTTFVAIAGPTVSVPAGATSFIVRVPSINDTLGEPSEAMTLAASTSANAAPVVGTGTIIDNDTPVVSISGPATYNEAAGTATYTVTLSNPATAAVTVNYATADGSAVAGTDYTAGAGTVTFAAGVTSQTITVAIANDAVFEGGETFTVSLSAPSGATLGTVSSTTTIADDGTGVGGTDDDRPRVGAVSSPTVAEGSDLDFSVTLTNASTTSTTVTVTPASGSATLGTDTNPALVSFDGGITFVAIAGPTVSVPAGATSFIVRMPSVNDTLGEPSETISLAVSTPANAVPMVGTGTIVDNDTPVVSVSGPAVIDEAAGTATYTVTLSNAASTPVTVNYATADGSALAGTDYSGAAGTLTFAPGVTTQTITVAIANDSLFEGGETFSVDLSAPVGATLGTASVGSLIADDGRTLPGGGTANDDTPSLSVSAAPVVEGGPAVFTVSLSNASTTPAVFTPSLASGTATLGTDTSVAAALEFFDGAAWVAVAGDVTIAAGATSVQLRIATTDDAVSEGNETFSLTATPVSGTTLAPATAVSTIVDNDGTPQFSIDDVTVNEGSGTITFTVSLSNPAAAAVTVDYAGASGTATVPGDVAAGANALTGTLNFGPGVVTQTITLNVVNDTVFEGSEAFNITLSNASAGAVIADATGVGTITDDGTGLGGADNDTPALAVSSPTVAEGGSFAVFTVSLSNTSTQATTVSLTTAGGTATPTTDFGTALEVSTDGGTTWAAATSATIAAGASSVLVRAPIVADTTDESDETFTLTATRTAGTTSNAAASGTATLTDDDAAPSIASVSSASAVEAASIVHTVTLSNASSLATTYSLALTDVSATGGGTDYTSTLSNAAFSNGVTLAGGIITVPAGVTSFTVSVPTTADTLDETDETYTLTVGAAAGTGTVTDDDAAPSIASVSADTQLEGVALVHTVTLSNASSVATTFAYSLGGGSATGGGTDYSTPPTFSNGVTLAGGILTVPAGVTSFTVTVPTTADTIDEGASEDYTLSVGGVAASGTLTDDDAAPSIASVSSASAVEAASIVHTVTLSNASSLATTYSLALTDVSATGGGTDYTSTLSNAAFSNGVTLAGGIITVPAGVTSFTVSVPTTADTLDETDETYTLTVGAAAGTGTVTDDDAAPSIASVSADTQLEGVALVHTVTLSNASSVATTFAYSLGGGSATGGGTDYSTPPTFSNGVTLAGGILTVPAGVTSFTVTVPTTADTIDEGASEDYTLSVGGVAASGTLTDDDAAPSIASVSSASAVEAASIVHTVTLSNASSLATTYSLALTDVSATGGGTDYTSTLSNAAFSNGVTLAGGIITVPAGVTSFTVSVPTTADTLDETDETYTLTVGAAAGTGTVTDDDAAPSIASVSADTQLEGVALVHTVTLSNASSVATTFAYSLGGGSATGGGTDYSTPPTFSNGVTLAGGILTVPAGVTSFTVTVPTTADTIDEGASEDYTLSVGGVAASGTLTDDDAAPSIASVSSASAVEAASIVHTVTLSNASSLATTYSLALTDVSATGGGTDYTSTLSNAAFSNGVTLAGGIITVPAGVTSFTVSVPTTADTLDETDETYTLTVGAAAGTGTVTDDDAAPSIASVSADTQLEGVALVHTVTLSNASSVATTFAYSLGGGSATGGGTDYSTPPTFSNGVTLAGGILTVPAGVTSFTVTVPTTADTIDEGASEDYTLSVGGVAASGTLTDDDAAPSIASVSSASAVEAASIVHTVTLSNASSLATTYSLALTDVSATGGGTDYTSTLSNAAFSNGVTLAGGIITVPAGVTSFTVSVPTTADTLDETDETYTLTVGAAAGTGTVTDDDAAPSIASVSADTQLEGVALVHTVTLSNASSVATTFAYSLGGGSATGGGTDYSTPPTFSNGVTLAGGILTVPAGVTSFTVTVPTTADTIDEGASEDYTLSVGGVAASGTLTDDDAAPSIASVSSASAVEAASIVHTVTLSNASSLATTYSLALTDVSATGGGTDYTSTLSNAAFSNGVTLAGGIITVPAGVTSFTVSVPTTADTLDETDETYTLTVGAAAGTGTVTDDDAAPSIASVSADTQLEGVALVHTVTLSNASSVATTFAYSLGGGSATGGGTDYSTPPTFSNGVTLAGGILTVPAGVTSFTVTVPTTADTIDEGASEDYTLSVGGVAASGTLTDDDAAPSIASVSSASAVEAASIVHTVTLSNASSLATTYSLALTDVSATGGGTDYTSTLSNAAFSNGVTLAGGIITVPAGVTSFTVSVPTTADTLDETDETYTLTVGAAAGTGTVTDDDAAPSIASVSADTQLEGVALVHTVTLSNASSVATTFAYSLGGGSATGGGTDYSTPPTFSNGVTLAGGILTVPAGVTSFTVTVPTTADTIDEGASEDYTLSVGGVAASGTLTDDDAAPSIASVSSASAVEAASIVHTVTLSNASSLATTYSLALTDVSATGGGTDYTSTLSNAAFSNGVTLAGGIITVPAGVTSFTVSVPTTADTLDETDETYTLTVGAAAGTGTVTDDDAAPSIASVSADTQLEGVALVHTVTLSNASSVATTFAYSLGGGSATGGGTDYSTPPTFSNGVTLAGGILTVPAGVTSFTVTVPTTADTIDEGASEDYTLSVGGVAASGTLTDDDAAPSIASVSSASAVEAASIVHTVTLSNASSLATTYSLALTDVSATGGGTDYTSTLSNAAFSNGVTLAGGIITVPAGVTSFTVSVPTTADTLDETDETYTLTVGAAAGTGTVTDDDAAPSIASVSADTQLEGVALVHTVTLSNASSVATTFAYSLGGGSATGGGTDYSTPPTFSNGVTLAGGILTVPAGVTSFTVTVPTTADTIDEGASEDYTLSVGGVAASGTLTDDDAAPSIASVSSASAVEAASIVHTVTLSNASSLATTYSLALTDVSATGGGTDYTSTLSNAAFSNGVTLAGGIITVPAGVTSFTVSVPTTADTLDETDETYTLTVGAAAGTGTVTDDDAAPSIASVSADTQLEGVALVHTVTLSNASSVATTFAYSLGGGSATGGGTDYSTPPTFSNGVTLAGGILTVPAGVTSFTVTVPTTADTIDEGASEDYTLSVGGVAASGTLTDDDAAPSIASVSSASAVEAASIVHTVTLSNASSLATTYSLALTDVSATGGGTDYTSTLSNAAFSNGVTLAGGIITVPAGVTSFTVSVPTTADTLDETDETYTLTVGAAAGTGTVTDDDAAPSIASVSADTQLEGVALVHTVTLSNASSVATTFAYSLGGGSATGGGTDYSTPPTFSNGVTLAGGILTVPAGVTSFTVTVPTTADTIDEGASEDYTLSVGGVAASGTLTDDDAAPSIASVSSASAVEAASIVHTVTLSNASSLATTYSLALTDVSATGGGTDYTSTLSNAAFSNGVTLAGGIITVPAGVTSFTVSVPTTADTLDETDETYTLTVGAAAGTGTVTDDDAAPSIASVSADTQLEGVALVHTVTLSNASSVATTFAYSLGGGSATGGGTDYSTPPTFSNGVTLAGGILTVPAGVTSFTVTVPTTADTIDEGASEDYTLSVGGVAASGTLTDDDAAPSIASVSSASAVEAASIVHTVTLSNASSLATTYSLALTDVSATGGGTDYTSTLSNAAFSNGVTLAGGIITVPAGVTSFTVSVPTTADTLDETDETYTLTVGAAAGTGTVTDDDAAPSIASVSADTQLEGVALVHTVTLSNASSVATTFAYSLGGGSATGGGTDYSTPPTFSNGVTLAGGILTVPAGVTSFTVTVPTTADTIDEGASEDYTLSVGGVAASGTLTDDDAAPSIASVSSASAVEAASIVHTVTLSNASSLATTYSLALTDVSATGGGTDYTSTLSNAAFSNGVTLAGGIITVPAGVTSFTVSVPTTADTLDETDETYTLTVGAAAGTGTVTDDDAAPSIASVSADTQLEGVALVHTVTLSNASSVATTFAYSLGGGSATGGGTDYSTPPTFSNGVTLAGGILTVPAGVTSFTVTVPTTADTIDEGASEDYTLSVGGVAASGTLTDDDAAPSIASVSSASAVEAASIVHTVTLSNASSLATTYSLALTDVSATGGGTDYTSTLSNAAFSNGVTLAGGIITVPAGVTSFTVSVPTTADTLDETDETYTLTVGAAAGTGTVTDDDAAPSIASVSADTQLEGVALVHTVTLSNASSVATTFAYSLGGGSATGGGTDYSTPPTFSNGVTLAGGILTVPAGVTSFTVTVPTTADTIDEGASEDYTLSVGGVAASGTLTDDDAAPSIASVSSASAVEAASIVHTVTLSNASSLATTYSLALTDVSATGGGTDYTSTLSNAAFSNGVTLAGGIITVPAGVTSFTVSVPTTADTLDETDETYTLTVGAAAGTGTVTDDDAAPSIASVSADTQLEGVALVHTVTLSNASSVATTFAYSLGGGSATGGGTDYSTPPTFSNGVTLAGGILTVPAGVTSFTVTVPTTADTIDEGASEDYTLSVGGVAASGTLTDDDAAPSIASVSSASAVEAASIVHTVTLSNASSLATTYSLALTDVSATGGGTDYTSTLSNAAFSNGVTLAGGIITVPAGVTSFTVSVPTTADTLDETDETYTLTVGAAAGTGTVTDDDAAPSIASVSSPTVVEGADLVYSVALSNASASPTTFAYTLGGGSASAADFGTPTFSNGVTLAAGILTVPAGVTAFTVTLPTVQDVLNEASETVPLAIGGTTGTGTITDNDAVPTLSINDVSVNESAGTATFTVTLSAASGQTVTVGYNSSNGTATAGSDYTALVPGTLTFAPGVLTQTVTLAILNDLVNEPTETFNVNLSAPTNATIADNLGIGTILDNDARPVNTVPVAQSTAEDTSRVFSGANGNAITVADADSTTLTTTLNVNSGTLTLGSTAGVTVTGDGTGAVQLVGTAAAINTALNGTSYKPTTDFSGGSTLTVTTSDGTSSDVDTVAITVTPVADAPTLYAHISTPTVSAGTSFFSDNFNDGNFTAPAWTRVQLLLNTFAADPTSTKGQTEAQLFAATAWNGQTSNPEWTNFWTVGAGQVRYNASGGSGSDDAQGMLAYTALSVADRARTNYAVSLDMFANPASEQNNGGGLVFGYQNANNYFLARWENPGTSYQPGGSQFNAYPGQANQLSLVQMVGGVPVDLGTFANFSTTTAFNLRVEVSNLGIQVFADDTGAVYNGITPLISYTYGSVAGAAATPPALNTTGLYTFDNDAGITFDNVQVRGLNYNYALDLQATLNDTDGSESLSAITLSGLPVGVTLTGPSGAIAVSGGIATVPVTSGVDTIVTVSSTTQLTPAQISAIQSSVTATDTGGVTATTTTGVTQELLGNPGVNSLTGTAAGDWIEGRAGNDTLSGGNGNDVLLGGPGTDSLTGGAGADVFKWALADRGTPGAPPTDTVTDFNNAAGGDVLDLRDLLSGENSGSLSNYLHITTAGGNTTIQISSTGGFSTGFSSGAVDQVVQLTGVNLVGGFTTDAQIINDLLNRGKLVTDGT